MSAGIKMTFEEFQSLPEQAGLELIDGWVVKESSPSYGHQACVGFLFAELNRHVRERGLGRVLVAPLDVILSREHVLQPDVSFVSHERAGILRDTGLAEAPDLAVEVLSPSTRRYDAGRKRELYFQFGCRELWLVDLRQEYVEVCVRADSLRKATYTRRRLYGGALLYSDMLPGFGLDAASVFAESKL